MSALVSSIYFNSDAAAEEEEEEDSSCDLLAALLTATCFNWLGLLKIKSLAGNVPLELIDFLSSAAPVTLELVLVAAVVVVGSPLMGMVSNPKLSRHRILRGS